MKISLNLMTWMHTNKWRVGQKANNKEFWIAYSHLGKTYLHNCRAKLWKHIHKHNNSNYIYAIK